VGEVGSQEGLQHLAAQLQGTGGDFSGGAGLVAGVSQLSIKTKVHAPAMLQASQRGGASVGDKDFLVDLGRVDGKFRLPRISAFQAAGSSLRHIDCSLVSRSSFMA